MYVLPGSSMCRHVQYLLPTETLVSLGLSDMCKSTIIPPFPLWNFIWWISVSHLMHFIWNSCRLIIKQGLSFYERPIRCHAFKASNDEDKLLHTHGSLVQFICFSDGGSDSSVSDGLPVHLQYMADKVCLREKLPVKQKWLSKRKSSAV